MANPCQNPWIFASTSSSPEQVPSAPVLNQIESEGDHHLFEIAQNDFDAIQLTFTVNDISHLINHFKKIVRIRNLLWKIKFCEIDEKLCIHFSMFDNNKMTKNSIILAICKITIVSTIKEQSRKFYFNHFCYKNNFVNSVNPLITKKELFKPCNGFVMNDSCTFVVKIKMSEMQDFSKCDGMKIEPIEKIEKCGEISGKFHLTLNKFLLDKPIGVCSPEFKFHNIPCHITIMNEKCNGKNSILFGIFSSCSTGSCQLSIISELLSLNSKIHYITKKCSGKSFKMPFGMDMLCIKRKNLFDRDLKFFKNDLLILEFQLKIEQVEGLPKQIQLEFECPICMECLMGRRILSTKCGHMFCEQCITKAIRNDAVCPVCRSDSPAYTLRPIFLPTK